MDADFGVVSFVLNKKLKDEHGLESYCRVVKVGDRWIRDENPTAICEGLEKKTYPITITFQE